MILYPLHVDESIIDRSATGDVTVTISLIEKGSNGGPYKTKGKDLTNGSP